MNIQWYPGHMAKTRRRIAESLRQVDAVCEILDARIPVSSRNPDIDALTAGKPRLTVLNRADQADPDATARWAERLRGQGRAVLVCDAKSGRGTAKFPAAVRGLLAEKLRTYAARGQSGRTLRVMVLGIPNVGKSTFINRVAKRNAAKAEDRPGVTRGGQWIVAERGLELLDTPGVLWPKFDDPAVGERLAFTGAVKDEVLDTETLGCRLAAYLAGEYPEALRTAYRLPALPARDAAENADAWGWRLLEAAGRRRGYLISGGEADTERMARTLLDEFRAGKLGRFTLESPDSGTEPDSGTTEKPDSGTEPESGTIEEPDAVTAEEPEGGEHGAERAGGT